jgi:23S rRNA (pseudouridine1915-N3)-methyltransferase
MKITLVNIGKIDQSFIREGITDFQKRIGYFVDFSIVDLPEIKQARSLSPDQVKQKEGEQLLKFLSKSDLCILLDERGTELSSRGFSSWLEKNMNQGTKHIIFVTGGAYGFSEDIYKVARQKISLSQMTFTHQMVRLIFTEQLYRALTLIKGIPYHND